MSATAIYLALGLFLLRLTVCHSCGEPGSGYVLAATSTSSGSTAVGEEVELTCRLSCAALLTSNVTRAGSTLQWVEGGVVVEPDTRRNIVATATKVVLQIRNLTLSDYGRYQCRCINMYDYVQFRACGHFSGLPSHCAASTELDLLPPGRNGGDLIEAHSVSSPGESADLGECSEGWWRLGNTSQGDQEGPEGSVVTLSTPQDQAKFICHNNTSVQKIVYVAIKGYIPLRILYPTSDVANIRFSSDLRTPLCAFYTSFPNTTTATIDHLPMGSTIDRDSRQCGWVVEYFAEYGVGTNTLRCSVTSPWESLTISFTVSSSLDIKRVCPVTETELTAPHSTAVCTVVNNTELLHLSVSSSYTLPAIPSLSLTPPLPSPRLTISTEADSVSVPSLITAPSPFSTLMSLPLHVSTENNSLVFTITASLVAAVIAIVGVVLTSIIFILKCRRKKRRPRKMYKLPYTNGSFVPELPQNYADTLLHRGSLQTDTSQLFNLNGVQVSKQMAKCISSLLDTQWLFPYKKLEFGEKLGSGAFGIVMKGKAHGLLPRDPTTTVAVKMLKASVFTDITATEEEEKDIISELKVLRHVGAHPNIVNLLGASLNEGMLYIIVEFCSNGSLLQFLRSKRNDHTSPLTARGCVDMASQVATGMEFLHSKDCIHRDLAARNVLITDDFVMKVADFGMARKMYESVYRPSGGKVPVKWLAPESILDQVYTGQSDVWSFGVVLWEIMSLGRSPYPGMSADVMIREVEGGYRLPRPQNCPKEIYDVMQNCWQMIPTARSNFTDLIKLLEEILTADEPALNRHYYNIDVRFTPAVHESNDSILCSCNQDPDFPLQTSQCFSCGNTFSTTRHLSLHPDKVFCDDCSLMPEYLSRSSIDLLSSCDESNVISVRARLATRLHSNDSGVKVSSEGTSEDYQVASGPRATAFAKMLAQSLQSVCSECKGELQLPAITFGSVNNPSLASLCSSCKGLEGIDPYLVVCSTPTKERVEHRNSYDSGGYQNQERLLLTAHCPNTKQSSNAGGALNHSAFHKGTSQAVVSASQKPDTESTAMSEGGREGWEVGGGGRREVCFSSASTVQYSHDCPTPLTSGCPTPGRLSAHPRNRVLFEELGFTETDL